MSSVRMRKKVVKTMKRKCRRVVKPVIVAMRHSVDGTCSVVTMSWAQGTVRDVTLTYLRC
jgi:hypothetical protein